MGGPKPEENPDYDPFLDDKPIDCRLDTENPESCESCT